MVLGAHFSKKKKRRRRKEAAEYVVSDERTEVNATASISAIKARAMMEDFSL